MLSADAVEIALPVWMAHQEVDGLPALVGVQELRHLAFPMQVGFPLQHWGTVLFGLLAPHEVGQFLREIG